MGPINVKANNINSEHLNKKPYPLKQRAELGTLKVLLIPQLTVTCDLCVLMIYCVLNNNSFKLLLKEHIFSVVYYYFDLVKIHNKLW